MALDRFEVLGLVRLPSEKPFSRDDVAGYAREIKKNIDGGQALQNDRDRFEWKRLEQEFLATSQSDPKTRWDPPALFGEDSEVYVEGDLALSFVPDKPLLDPRWWMFGVAEPVLRLHIRDWLTYEVRYRLVMGPERDDRVDGARPSPRERSVRGLTSIYERSYIAYRWNRLTLYLGREYLDWGPNDEGNLHITRTAESLDQFGGRVDFKNFRFSFFHSNLSTETLRYLSGHRLEGRFGKFVIGLSETALYLDRNVDPVYMLPLSSFYANQYNERDDDNILWAVDLKYRATAGLLLFGSLLIDDFQYERDGTAPDKIAFDVGTRAALATPVPVTVKLRYRYTDIYTYTHRDSLMAHVGGTGDLDAGEPLLGAEEGPDTDVITASAAFYPRHDVTTTLGFSYLRRGEGNDFRTHNPGDEPSPPFPLGVVENTMTFGLGLIWELPGNSSVDVEVRQAKIENIDHQPGRDEWDTAFRMVAKWNFR